MEVVVTLNNRKLWADYRKALNNFDYAFHNLPDTVKKKMLANSIKPHDDIGYLDKQLNWANEEWDKLDPLSAVKVGGYYKYLFGEDAYKTNDDRELFSTIARNSISRFIQQKSEKNHTLFFDVGVFTEYKPYCSVPRTLVNIGIVKNATPCKSIVLLILITIVLFKPICLFNNLNIIIVLIIKI